MLRFGEFIAKRRVLILLIGVLLLIPSAIGYINTRVNYDILSYLPKDINTMVGQDILIDEFGQGGFSFVMVDGMTEKEIADTADKISQVDGVSDVVCYEKLTDLNVPKEILPSTISLVVPGISVTIALLSFSNRFKILLLPTFGLPTITVLIPSVNILPFSYS